MRCTHIRSWLYQCRKRTLGFSLLFWFSNKQTATLNLSWPALNTICYFNFPAKYWPPLTILPTISNPCTLSISQSGHKSKQMRGRVKPLVSVCLAMGWHIYCLRYVPPNQHESVCQHYIIVTHITHHASSQHSNSELCTVQPRLSLQCHGHQVQLFSHIFSHLAITS